MNGRGFIFRGYGASVQVDVPDELGMDDLMRHTAPELSIEKNGDGPPDLLLTCWDRVYHLVIGERRYGPYPTADTASHGVAEGIHFLLGKRSPMTFLHAGAIEIDGWAVVFPGHSGSGKSALVSSLVDQGCGYLSDEYAVISPEGSVLPLSKPIRLRREEGGEVFRDPPGVSAPDGLPCAAMVLTRYERDAIWDPEPLTRGSAILGILPAALQSRDAPEQVTRALTALVDGASTYRAARGDGEPTIEALRNLNPLRRMTI